MGIKGMMRSKKKSFKSEKTEKWRRQKKREKKKQMATKVPKSLEIEDIHLFSTQKLRNKLRNPTNNIQITGKKRRRLTKRLGHALREKSKMEVEKAASSWTKDIARSQGNEDQEMDDEDESSSAPAVTKEAALNALSAAAAEVASGGSVGKKKKKKRGGRKNKTEEAAKNGGSGEGQGPLFDTAVGWEDVDMSDS